MNEMSSTDRTLATLFAELTRETGMLFRQELELAKAEVAEKIGQARFGLVAVIAGGALLFGAFQALVAAAVLGLATVLGGWLAALVVGALLALIGAVAMARGLAIFKRDNLTPRRTLDTLKANTRWAREQMP